MKLNRIAEDGWRERSNQRLRMEGEIVQLADLHIRFNSLLECGVNGAKQYWDDYEMPPFSQSTKPGRKGWRRKRDSNIQNN